MEEENKNQEFRETVQSNASEALLRDTRLTNIENIIEEEENKDAKDNKPTKKVNSLGTVLSIGNSMIGSSIMTLPYNVYKTGIIPAIVLNIIYDLISFYTCKIYVDFGSIDSDFSLTIEKYFNKVFGKKISKIGKAIQIFFCTFMATGGFITYFIIMSQNFYPVVCLILNKLGLDYDPEDLTPDFTRFSSIYLGIALCFILFPLSIKKDIGLLVFISSFGCYFISVLIGYVLYTGVYSIVNTEFKFDYIKNKDGENIRYLYLFGENPALLAGTLSMGFFCHTAILPILKSNKNQSKNIRDLFLGYLFVGLVYIFCGVLGYVGFSGKQFKAEFKDNWLMFFESDDYLILVFRVLNVFQLITAFPILIYIVRFQIFTFFCGNEYPSRKHVIICGLCQLFLCLIVFYFCYNILAKLLSIFGACASLILVYTFPPIVKMIDYYLKHKKNINLANKEENDDEIKEEIKEENKEEIKEEKIKNKSSCKDVLFYLGHFCLILTGIVTVIFQFVPINFFNIVLRD